jgi:hypothetical protein
MMRCIGRPLALRNHLIVTSFAGPVVSENVESWLEWREAGERPVPEYVEGELRGSLECGIPRFGFARAVCTTCRTGFVVAARLSRPGWGQWRRRTHAAPSSSSGES